MIKTIIVPLFLSLAMSCYGDDLRIKKNSQFVISKSNSNPIGKDIYLFERESVRLEDGAVIVIDNSLLDKELIIKFKEMSAFGKNLIIQPISEDFKGPYELTEVDHPKSNNGSNGQGKSGSPSLTSSGSAPLGNIESHNGQAGGKGSDGRDGRDSTKLTLDVGIKFISDLKVVVKSESGGNGGKGGKGQDGEDASCYIVDVDGTDGGNSGNGGSAGLPGNIPTFTFKWKKLSALVNEDLNNIPNGLTIDLIAGVSGFPGIPGKPGRGGYGRKCTLNLALFEVKVFELDSGEHGHWGEVGTFKTKDNKPAIGSSKLIVRREL